MVLVRTRRAPRAVGHEVFVHGSRDRIVSLVGRRSVHAAAEDQPNEGAADRVP